MTASDPVFKPVTLPDFQNGNDISARRREGSKLNAEKLEQARALLVQGHTLAVVSAQTGVLSDTLRKAISAGRLPAVKKKGTQSLGPRQLKDAR